MGSKKYLFGLETSSSNINFKLKIKLQLQRKIKKKYVAPVLAEPGSAQLSPSPSLLVNEYKVTSLAQSQTGYNTSLNQLISEYYSIVQYTMNI